MKRVGTIAVCLAVVTALSGLVAVSASATAPEFGRCLKKAKPGGAGFLDGGCTEASSLAGRYEWSALILKKRFSSHDTTLFTLESVGGTKITCTGSSVGGEYVGPKTIGNLTFEFSGCEWANNACTSAGRPLGTIASSTLEGELGVETVGETQGKNKLGIVWLAPEGGPVARWTCATLFFEVVGSVIHPAVTNKMLLTEQVIFTASKGEQKPDKFAGEGTDAHTLEWNHGTGFEELGWTLSESLTNEEKVEASSVN